MILELVVSAWLAQADVVHWPEGADGPAVVLVAGETLPPRSEWRGIAEAAACREPGQDARIYLLVYSAEQGQPGERRSAEFSHAKLRIRKRSAAPAPPSSLPPFLRSVS